MKRNKTSTSGSLPTFNPRSILKAFLLFVTISSLFLASFFAEAETVHCRIFVETTKGMKPMTVTGTVLDKSDLRYEVDVYDSIKQELELLDRQHYKKLLLGKELCSSSPYSTHNQITNYTTSNDVSFLDVNCGNGRYKVVSMKTKHLKKLTINQVEEKITETCLK